MPDIVNLKMVVSMERPENMTLVQAELFSKLVRVMNSIGKPPTPESIMDVKSLCESLLELCGVNVPYGNCPLCGS